jgi:hypothetical protein
VLNPRDVSATSLLLLDKDWLDDMARHREWLKYVEDADKRPSGRG